MGWINPYTVITWHRPVGIRLSWSLSPTFQQQRRCRLTSVLYENRTVRYRLTNQANDATPLNWCSSTSHAQFPPKKVVDLIKLRSQGNQAARQPPAICPVCLPLCLPAHDEAAQCHAWHVSYRIFNGIIKNEMSIFHRKFAVWAAKGQIKPWADWRVLGHVLDSPKKRTNDLFFLKKTPDMFVCFFGRIYGAPICLRFYLTFNQTDFIITKILIFLVKNLRR